MNKVKLENLSKEYIKFNIVKYDIYLKINRYELFNETICNNQSKLTA